MSAPSWCRTQDQDTSQKNNTSQTYCFCCFVRSFVLLFSIFLYQLCILHQVRATMSLCLFAFTFIQEISFHDKYTDDNKLDLMRFSFVSSNGRRIPLVKKKNQFQWKETYFFHLIVYTGNAVLHLTVYGGNAECVTSRRQ